MHCFLYVLCIAFNLMGFNSHATAEYYGAQFLNEDPFWRVKTKVYNKIKKDRSIVVSVTTQSLKDDNTKWFFRGGGWIEAPLEFSWRLANDFERLKELPNYFQRVSYVPDKKKLFLRVKIFGVEKEIVLHMQLVESKNEKRLHWKNLEGLYQGMEGVLVFKAVERQKTEVSMSATYQSKETALPWLVTFAVEALIHHVAVSLRNLTETEYNQQGSHGEELSR